MRISIMGTRGVPADYGGFETFAKELGERLAARGHQIFVYCRSNYVPTQMREHLGMRLIVLPAIRHKYFETVSHTALSVLHGLAKNRVDLVLMCNAANALFSGIPRLAGQKVVLNVDGLEWRRKKWNAAGKLWYLAGARLAKVMPNAIVTDAESIRRFYRERLKAESTMIAYGAQAEADAPAAPVLQLGLEPHRYFLYVSRLEPENNADSVIAGFKSSSQDRRLAIVGDAPYSGEYIARLRRMAAGDERIIMTGGVYGQGYRSLQVHAFAYIHATEVGGTHPALVEAMAAGNCVLCLDTPENREVLGNAGMFWSTPEQLGAQIETVASDQALAARLAGMAAARARQEFSWEAVSDRYEALFRAVLNGRRCLDTGESNGRRRDRGIDG